MRRLAGGTRSTPNEQRNRSPACVTSPPSSLNTTWPRATSASASATPARAAALASEHSSVRAKPFGRDSGGGRAHVAARPQPRRLKLTRILFDQAGIIAAVAGSLIVAGFLKGIIGVGMPVVALPLLSL